MPSPTLRQFQQLFVLTTALLANIAFAADWTYDSSAGTISDGDWTFAATVNGTDLTVGACSKYPEAASLLDFSKPVTDGEVSYDIVALNTALGTTADLTYGQNMKTTPAGLAVSELRFADNGTLKSIGFGAFGRLDNCTKITPLLPDSVTTMAQGAFWGCKAEQDVRLYGVAYVNYTVFIGARVKSVTFGPALKGISCAWNSGSFNQCAQLTNITFDAKMSGAYFHNTVNGGAFENCALLTGTLDLRGFSKVNYYAFNGTGYDIVLLGTNLTQLASNAFNGMSKLTTVKFYGAPPTTLGTPVFEFLAASQIIASYVMSEDPDVRAAWAAKTAGGVLNKTDSTWHADYVVSGSVANRFLVLPSGGSGETGFWVFDDSTKKLSSADGKWEFSASRSFIKLTIGACTKWPNVVDELDFTKRITTADGAELVLYELDTKFASGGSGEWGYFANGNPTITEAAQYVGRLVLPTEGLEMIRRGAFAGCTSLTNVVPYLPDSVSYLGVGAFFRVPAEQDVRAYCVNKVGYLTFGRSGITSITFGPSFKYLQGFYANVPFHNCTNLTNVWFDVGMSGGSIDSSSDGSFAGCTKLKGRLDLRGFTDIGLALNIQNTKLEEFVIGDAVKKLTTSYFYNTSTVTNIIFLGRPPVTLETPYLNGVSASRTVMTTVYHDYLGQTNSAGKCWRDYAADRKICPVFKSGKTTTWATNYVASGINLAKRPLICPDGMYPGLKLILR